MLEIEMQNRIQKVLLRINHPYVRVKAAICRSCPQGAKVRDLKMNIENIDLFDNTSFGSRKKTTKKKTTRRKKKSVSVGYIPRNNDPITKKMNSDNSATSSSHKEANNGGNNWSAAEIAAHTAGQLLDQSRHGSPYSAQCSSCHQGRFDY